MLGQTWVNNWCADRDAVWDRVVAELDLALSLDDQDADVHRILAAVSLTRDELLFLIKLARENYSFIVRIEKEARLALAAKLHKTAESVFGVTSKEE